MDNEEDKNLEALRQHLIKQREELMRIWGWNEDQVEITLDGKSIGKSREMKRKKPQLPYAQERFTLVADELVYQIDQLLDIKSKTTPNWKYIDLLTKEMNYWKERAFPSPPSSFNIFDFFS